VMRPSLRPSLRPLWGWGDSLSGSKVRTLFSTVERRNGENAHSDSGFDGFDDQEALV
jgi:hypothetical protein